MKAGSASYRQILRSTSIIGSASVLNIVLSIVKIKVVAVLLGPAGVGLMGLLSNVMGTASTLAGMGLGMVGTRQIAEANARQDEISISAARRALYWGTLALSLIGGFALLLLREPIAYWIFGNTERQSEIGWIGVGVALTVASSSQGALLNGLRHVDDLARISVLGAATSASIGLGALWFWGEAGILCFVISVPFASFVISSFFVAKVPKILAPPTPIRELSSQWRMLLQLGFSFMLAGLALMAAQLFVRSLIQKSLGTEALGYFQASWVISMTYIGLIVGAMSTDFYPRLTGVIQDHDQVNRLVNEQTEVALLLSAPVFIAILSLAPWVVEILYTKSFLPAVSILRWQILGDVLKVASWPLGFIILASGDGKTFLMTEAISLIVFVLGTYFLLPWLGVDAAGVAFLLLYLSYLPFVYVLARKKTGYVMQRPVFWHLVALIVCSIAIFIITSWMPLTGALCGCVIALFLSMYALAKLSQMTESGGMVGRIGQLAKNTLPKIWFGN